MPLTRPVAGDVDDAALRRRISDAVASCLVLCADIARAYRVSLPAPEIRFDLRGRSAGQCAWRPGTAPLLRFNMAIARHHSEDFIRTTVPHEVAHLVTTSCHGRVSPHGTQWRAVMRHLGIAHPSRCHDYAIDETSVQRQRRWSYRCDCRHHALSTTRHNRVQRRLAEYHCRCCGSALRFEPEQEAAQS